MTALSTADITRGVERYADEATNTLYRLAWHGRIHFGLWLERGDTIADAAARVPPLLAREIALSGNDHVLEIGSGAGATAIDLAGLTDCRITATNISQVHAREADTAVRAAGLTDRIETAIADAQDLPFEDAAFSVHWSQEVVVHVPRRHRAVREAHRVLAPGGRLMWTEYTVDRARLRASEFAQIAERQGSDELWNRDDYIDAFRRGGFTNIRLLDWSSHLGRHFDALVANIDANRPAFDAACGKEVVSWNRFIWSLGARYAHDGTFGWYAFIADKS